jgi:hypothetical protein
VSTGDFVAVLQAVDGARLTKRITRREDGSFEVVAYDRGYLFAVQEMRVAGIIELGRQLGNLEGDPRACVIRGRPLPEADRQRCRRLYLPHVEDDGSVAMPTFEPAPRRWIGLDFDALTTPQWNQGDLARRREAIARDRLEHPPHLMRPKGKGPDEGEGYDFDADANPAPIDPARDWALAIRAAVSTLPAEFEPAHAYWQLTSSAGVKSGIRLRLWYWLDRGISDAEAKRWLEGSPVDRSLFNPIQVHYTARPIFDPPDADPVPRRSGMWWRHVAEVSVPELPEPPSPETPEYSVRIRPTAVEGHRELARQCLVRPDLTTWERDFCAKAARLETLTPKQLEALTTIADPLPVRAAAYADTVLKSIGRSPAGDRHTAMRHGAIVLYQLAEHGLVDPAEMTGQLLSIGARLAWPDRRLTNLIDWCRAFATAHPDLPEAFK